VGQDHHKITGETRGRCETFKSFPRNHPNALCVGVVRILMKSTRQIPFAYRDVVGFLAVLAIQRRNLATFFSWEGSARASGNDLAEKKSTPISPESSGVTR